MIVVDLTAGQIEALRQRNVVVRASGPNSVIADQHSALLNQVMSSSELDLQRHQCCQQLRADFAHAMASRFGPHYLTLLAALQTLPAGSPHKTCAVAIGEPMQLVIDAWLTAEQAIATSAKPHTINWTWPNG